MSFEIKAPNEKYTGNSHGVNFVNGVGHTENEWFAEQCKLAGFEVNGSGEDAEKKSAAKKK